MHMMFGLVLHTTLLAIVGYALLWTAARAEGFVALLGRVLGVWVLLLAVLSVVGAVAIHLSGGKLFGMDMHDRDHGPGMHRWGPPDDMGPPPPPPPNGTPMPPPPPPPAKP